MPRITSIGITRLFSTGRFEHQKVSVTVDPGDMPAGTLLQEIEKLIGDLNPNCPVEDYQIERAKRLIANPPTEPDPYGDTLEDAQATMKAVEDWSAARAAAFARLDQLGSCEIEVKDTTPID